MKTMLTLGSLALGLTLTGTAVSMDDCRSSCSSSAKMATNLMVTAADTNRQSDIVETALAAGSFETLAAALGAADLVDALKSDGPFTVFAPTDEAFAKLPAGTVETLLKPENKGLLTSILTYHVVPGQVMASDVVNLNNATTLNGQKIDISTMDGVMVDNANVTKTDITCSNGVIHVIDRVILPSTDRLLETAAAAGDFGTLAAAIEAAGLVATLNSDGPFTVFAPTDDAFAALPAGTVESLLKPQNKEKLVKVLTYHVVPGRIYSSDVLTAQTMSTVQGQRIRFGIDKGTLMVDNARFLNSDIECSNGVIHVIDRVILPN